MGLAAFNRMRRLQGEKQGKKQGKKPESLEDMKVPQLKEIAKEKEIDGFSNMKKEELIEAIKKLGE